jgi:hypothetical protein
MFNEFELWAAAELTAWDNEGDAADVGDAGTADAGIADAGTADAGTKQAGERTFTQKDVDDIVVKRNKALKSQYESLENNYQTLLKQQNLTDDTRSQLEADLESVRSQMRTKEENLRIEKEKAAKEYETKLSSVQEQANYYKELYETSTIHREISDAQQLHDGYNPDQFVALLGPKAKIVEELDSAGEKTGRLVPRIEWGVKTEDGTSETVLLSPKEAVEKMKDDPDTYGNMFRPNVAKGVGQGTAPGQAGFTGKVDHTKISTEEYMQRRNDPEFRRSAGLQN